MATRITFPVFTLICLLFSLFCQAQNEVHCDLNIKTSAVNNSELGVVKHVTKGEFMFRKMKNWRVLNFTLEDAQLIEDFFFEKEEVLASTSQYIDKTVKIFVEREENKEEFPFKKYIDELQEMGYFIIRFHKADEIVVFPMKNCKTAIVIHDFEEQRAIYMECLPCSQSIVKTIQEVEKKENDLKVNNKVNNFDPPKEVDTDSLGFSQPMEQEKKGLLDETQKTTIETKELLIEKTEEIIDHSEIIEGVIDTFLREDQLIIETEGKIEDGRMPVEKKMAENEAMLEEKAESKIMEEEQQTPMNVDEKMMEEESIENGMDSEEGTLPVQNETIKQDKGNATLTKDQLPVFEKDMNLDKTKKEGDKPKDVPKKDNTKE